MSETLDLLIVGAEAQREGLSALVEERGALAQNALWSAEAVPGSSGHGNCSRSRHTARAAGSAARSTG